MTKPTISVIIPVYNVEKYVGECLDSILGQDFDNIEVIVVDDCSPDKSIDIVKKRFENYDGKKQTRIVHHERNRGLAAARNTGIETAQGDMIYFIDSDDYLARHDALSKLINRQIETGALIVAANNLTIDDLTKKEIKTISQKYTVKHKCQPQYDPEISVSGVAWNMLVDKDFIIHNDIFFDEGMIFEDSLWTFKLNCVGYSLATISDHTYVYRLRHQSLMNTLTEKHIISNFKQPVLAAEYLAKHKILNHSYALRAISDFRHGALMRCVTQVSNQEIFKKLFNKLRKECSSLSVGKVLSSNLPLLKKVRTLTESLPFYLTGPLAKKIIKRQYKNFNCTDGTKIYDPIYITPDNLEF